MIVCFQQCKKLNYAKDFKICSHINYCTEVDFGLFWGASLTYNSFNKHDSCYLNRYQ